MTNEQFERDEFERKRKKILKQLEEIVKDIEDDDFEGKQSKKITWVVNGKIKTDSVVIEEKEMNGKGRKHTLNKIKQFIYRINAESEYLKLPYRTHSANKATRERSRIRKYIEYEAEHPKKENTETHELREKMKRMMPDKPDDEINELVVLMENVLKLERSRGNVIDNVNIEVSFDTMDDEKIGDDEQMTMIAFGSDEEEEKKTEEEKTDTQTTETTETTEEEKTDTQTTETTEPETTETTRQSRPTTRRDIWENLGAEIEDLPMFNQHPE